MRARDARADYLDMIIDRVSSSANLIVAARVLLSGKTQVPDELAVLLVYVFYASVALVEVAAHGVVCYYAEVLGYHQKEMGMDYNVIALYLGNKFILFASCAAFELCPLALILNGAGALPSASFWLTVAFVAAPLFFFRAVANVTRLVACFSLPARKQNKSAVRSS